MKELNRKNIGHPTERPVKILQFGEGNFLRAFVDWIIDILNEKVNFDASVQLVQPIATGMTEALNRQDGLYHVILNGIQNGKAFREIRLITCIHGALNPYDDYHNFLKTGENADLKFIISNTTEAGIAFEGSDTSFEKLPKSFPGKLTALLYHRFKHFNGDPQKGLIIIPCELTERNGQLLQEAILQYISLWKLSDGFRKWITEHTTFCNTLVDRIVPGFPKETIQEIQRELEYEDNLVVTAEPFHLWVIEAPDHVKDSFPADKAGLQVKFVRDLTPYRTRKVRILNGAHTALVPLAYLRGLRTVRESIEDPFMGSFVKETIFEEIIPTLDLPESELRQFANDVIERFQNPYIKHELSSIALNSISKFKVRVLPSLLAYQQINHKLPERLVMSFAALIRFYKGNWAGTSLPVNDSTDVVKIFNEAWHSTDNVVRIILSNRSLWDDDLTNISGLVSAVESSLREIEKWENLVREDMKVQSS